jgi:lysine 6-dehydrogenase
MKVLVFGAGRMGYGVVYDLIYNSEVESVMVADRFLDKAIAVVNKIGSKKVSACQVDVSNSEEVTNLMKGYDVAVSCVDYWHNLRLSEAAIEAGTHFCDLGGNIFVVERQLRLNEKAKQAGVSVIPDCGLAPGMVSVLAVHGAKDFDKIEKIHIRVGGLPQNPKPPLNYQLVYSVEGLINEYVEPARVIRNGQIVEIPPMTEVEEIHFEGFPPLEAFQTSGGTSTLPETFLGRVKELDYKTIRYAGHCEKFKTMIDLGLCSNEPLTIDGQRIVPRAFFTRLLEKKLPCDEPDLVLVRLDFIGEKDGKEKHLRYEIVDKFDEASGLSAMMRTTSFPASIIAQMMAKGEVTERGVTPQEKVIDAEKFIAEIEKRNIRMKQILLG